MTKKRSGFTLIELLVVIAIIAILAAMLFPVFARARESARKIQCLSNVKNIAMAVQMYLTDYDRLWPHEHRQDVIAGYEELTGCSVSWSWDRLDRTNPYLAVPVILDEYIKNRDVWRCPSAPQDISFGIINPRGGDWWPVLRDAYDVWGSYGIGPCNYDLPPGWGGTVTDGLLQQEYAYYEGGPNVFIQDYMVTPMRETKTSAMDDPTKFLVVGDGSVADTFTYGTDVAYPDICTLPCAGPYCKGGGGWSGGTAGADWVNCPGTQTCGAGTTLFVTDAEYRKEHAMPRHLGGENLGFADGHAVWASSEAILNGMPDSPDRPVSDAQRTADSNRDNLITGGLFRGGLCGFM